MNREKAVGGNAQAGVVMKASPATAFVVAQPQILLEVLIVALDSPAHLGLINQALQRDALGLRGQPVPGGLGLVFGPFRFALHWAAGRGRWPTPWSCR